MCVDVYGNWAPYPVCRPVVLRIVVLGIGVLPPRFLKPIQSTPGSGFASRCWHSINLTLRALKGLRRAQWANMLMPWFGFFFGEGGGIVGSSGSACCILCLSKPSLWYGSGPRTGQVFAACRTLAID